jgi:hypothetical protein
MKRYNATGKYKIITLLGDIRAGAPIASGLTALLRAPFLFDTILGTGAS